MFSRIRQFFGIKADYVDIDKEKNKMNEIINTYLQDLNKPESSNVCKDCNQCFCKNTEELETIEISPVEAPVIVEAPEVFEAPVIVEAPVLEPPEVLETPVIVEAPVLEAPEVIEAPVIVDAVVVETPVLEAPVVEAVVVEAPEVIEPVVVEAPVLETPVLLEAVVVEANEVPEVAHDDLEGPDFLDNFLCDSELDDSHIRYINDNLDLDLDESE